MRRVRTKSGRMKLTSKKSWIGGPMETSVLWDVIDIMNTNRFKGEYRMDITSRTSRFKPECALNVMKENIIKPEYTLDSVSTNSITWAYAMDIVKVIWPNSSKESPSTLVTAT